MEFFKFTLAFFLIKEKKKTNKTPNQYLCKIAFGFRGRRKVSGSQTTGRVGNGPVSGTFCLREVEHIVRSQAWASTVWMAPLEASTETVHFLFLTGSTG